MKRSEIYQAAMRCVVESELSTGPKLEIIARLMQDKQYAELLEQREDKTHE